MKRLNRILALLVCLSLLLSATGCNNSSSGENTPPAISGVGDKNIEAGSEFDALAGVTASDAQDGDLTAMITVTSLPALTFQNGKTTPDTAGTYELTYSVTDKSGETAEAYATLTVTRQTGESVVFRQMDFATPASMDSHGWEASVAEGVDATGTMKDGAFVFDITSPGSGDGDIQLKHPGTALKAADYRVKIWVKSTQETYAHLLARDENAEGWSTFGGAYNMRIGTGITPLELNFTSPGEGSAELLLNLGKITPNPDNPADTTPENFTVTIDKIEIYEISGSEAPVPAYTNDFSAASADAVALSTGDGASGSAACSGDGTGVFQIDGYPTTGGVWSIKADIALPGVNIEAGQKYYYRFTLKSESDQSGELLVESGSQNDAARANFNSLSIAAGEEIVVNNVFIADGSVADPVIRMQVGNPSAGVTSNTLTVSNVEFGRMEGDLETVKTIHGFGVSYAANTNPDYLWTTYNGTDEDNDLGVGTLWTKDGSLFYRIDQGGSVDWHNKLIFGHGGNRLTLPADSYFTVQITGKASKPVSCGFFLNPMGGWDPRVSESIQFTTEEQTFTFETTDTLIMDMDFEMLFQFGSSELPGLGEVTIEITDITIYQRSVV